MHRFDLQYLADPWPLDVLRKVFTNPEALRPQQTTDEITQEIAEEFAALADGMRERGIEAHRATSTNHPQVVDAALAGVYVGIASERVFPC